MSALRFVWIALLAAAALAPISGCTSAPAGVADARPVDDATTTARVRNALFEQARMSSVDVNVNTYRGVVLLSGFVDSPEQARRAAEVAGRVRGVSRIDNALVVKPGD